MYSLVMYIYGNITAVYFLELRPDHRHGQGDQQDTIQHREESHQLPEKSLWKRVTVPKISRSLLSALQKTRTPEQNNVCLKSS